MTTGRNRLESIEFDNFEKQTADSAERCKETDGIENFVAEFRPVLSNFLAEILLYDTDIDAVLEETFEQFNAARESRIWRKTQSCRKLISEHLIETLLQKSAQRLEYRKSEFAMTLVIDSDTHNLPKRLAIAWRNHIVAESWHQLKKEEIASGRPVYTVLLSRYEKPWLTNSRLLRDLGCVFKVLPDKQAFRVFLIRCEQKLAQYVFGMVANTIHIPNSNVVKSEMRALDLLHFWERVVRAPVSVGLFQPK